MPDDAALSKLDPSAAPVPAEADLRERVIAALKTVYDPEIPVDIYELGLIYRLDIDAGGNVAIDMTLTAPGCPVAGEMPGAVEQAVEPVEGVASVRVELVWEPTWTPARMSEEAKLQLDMF
jgi:FeS assembly SUF system protein